MYKLTDQQDAKIESQPLNALKKGYVMLCDMEVELENKLKVIQSVKIRIMIEIDIRLNS
jgi:hypothetical protein